MTDVPPLRDRQNRLLVVILTLGPRPPTEQVADKAALRVARALATHPRLQVVLAPWTQLYLDDDSARVGGVVLEQQRGQLALAGIAQPLVPDALLYFPTGGTGPVGLTAAESAALRRFGAQGLSLAREKRFSVLRRLLVEATRRNVLTNAATGDSQWSLKDEMEKRVAAWEAATGKHLSRPRTFIARGMNSDGKSEAQACVDQLLRDGKDAIVKPIAGQSGVGTHIRLAGSTEPLPPDLGPSVVQELLGAPMVVRGYKFDLRAFALIDPSSRKQSYRPQTVLVRMAAARWERGKPEAEITSSAYRKRAKLPPATFPLEQVTSLPPPTRAAIHAALDQAVEHFLDAYFHWAQASGLPEGERHRMLLWGLDYLPSERDGKVELALLEDNIYPDLIQVPTCDGALAAMFAEDLAQMIVRSHKGLAAARQKVVEAAALGGTKSAEPAHAAQSAENTQAASAGENTSATQIAESEQKAPKEKIAFKAKLLPLLAPAEGRPTVALISLGPKPATLASPDAQVLHIARALAPRARVVVARWHQLFFDERPLLEGPVQHLDGAGNITQVLAEPLAADAMLFFPTAESGKVDGAPSEERAALARFASQKVSTKAANRYALVGGLLGEVARRGVTTNAAGRSGYWGYKDHLHKILRAFSDATAREVRRPATWTAHAGDVPLILSNLARRGIDCVIKGHDSARAEGIAVRLATSREPLPPLHPTAPTVIQELVRDPLIVDRRKCDLRCYVVIDTASRAASFRPRTTLVRLAGAPYLRGRAEAEITNTAFLRRRGLPSATHALEELAGLAPHVEELHAGLDRLTEDFLDGYFWWKDSPENRRRSGRPAPRRVMIWGLDVVATGKPGELAFWLLETNVYPHLLPNVKSCEPHVTRMLQGDYLPRLIATSATDSIG